MDYFIKSGLAEKQRSGCVIVGIWDKRALTEAAKSLDKASGGQITAVLRKGDLDGKLATTLLLHGLSGLAADRILLVGLGKEKTLTDRDWIKAHRASIRALRATGTTDAVSYLAHQAVKGRDLAWIIEQAVQQTEDVLYRFDVCRGDKARAALVADRLSSLTLDIPAKADRAAAERGLIIGKAVAAGTSLSKDLGNLPGNLCTPTHLAEQAKSLAKAGGFKAKVLEQVDMEKLGMGLLLSVARGSRQPPKLIVMEHLKGPKGGKPIVLVGKGLTFDAGGISIKPSAKMDEMKFDMCGSAAVFGAFRALAELKLPLNVVGIVPASENLPDGAASKPGDIVTSMAGITVEILNTDAEGRLILADALTYAERTYDPAACIDMATLTGACVVALGHPASGLFSNQAPLATALLEAGQRSGDRAWELPLWPEYDEQIASPFADIANIATKGAGEAGAIIGAVFLQRFAKTMNWAHLDIAGSAWVGKQSTGRPVPLLVHYLLSQVPATA